jgi:hypothetical protein
MMICQVCASELSSGEAAIIRGKHHSQFLSCPSCGFGTFSNIFWLEDAYATPITPSDIGYVWRNVCWADRVARLFRHYGLPLGNYVDFGSGYGMFVRLMRDRGYHFHSYDPYCANLFAQNTDASVSRFGRYQILTAFEVFEHLSDISNSLEEMLSFSDTILFSTDLIPRPIPPLDSWPYYGIEHGQHISFWTKDALQILARKNALVYTQLEWISPSFHLLAAAEHPLHRPVKPPGIFRRIKNLLQPATPTKSLLLVDAACVAEHEKRRISNGAISSEWHLDE